MEINLQMLQGPIKLTKVRSISKKKQSPKYNITHEQNNPQTSTIKLNFLKLIKIKNEQIGNNSLKKKENIHDIRKLDFSKPKISSNVNLNAKEIFLNSLVEGDTQSKKDLLTTTFETHNKSKTEQIILNDNFFNQSDVNIVKDLEYTTFNSSTPTFNTDNEEVIKNSTSLSFKDLTFYNLKVKEKTNINDKEKEENNKKFKRPPLARQIKKTQTQIVQAKEKENYLNELKQTLKAFSKKKSISNNVINTVSNVNISQSKIFIKTITFFNEHKEVFSEEYTNKFNNSFKLIKSTKSILTSKEKSRNNVSKYNFLSINSFNSLQNASLPRILTEPHKQEVNITSTQPNTFKNKAKINQKHPMLKLIKNNI